MTKLDIEMFHGESWKYIYFVIKDQGHKSQKTLLAWIALLLSAGP